ncbi:porin [Vibrio cholerae]|uniref:porin n=1 Tax=Vibrio cholerae TaxID=666 RepID=UPI0011D46151|nr:porin [Vibrio cholerae]TYA05809.1 porin [Vibrio cholerae]
MKKTLLALAVLAAAGSANAVEILKSDAGTVDFYGQIRVQAEFEEHKDTTLDAGSSRAGVKAKYALEQGIDILGEVEFSLASEKTTHKDEKATWAVRKHWLGVGTDFGSLKFGKQSVVADDVYGAEYSYVYGQSDGVLYPMAWLNSSLIKYEFTHDSFWVKASYGLREGDQVKKEDGKTKSIPNQELVEFYVGTSFGDLNLHAGVGKSQSETTFYQATGEYTLGSTLFGVTYSAFDKDGKNNDQDAVSLGVTHQLTKTLKPYIGYQMVDVEVGNDTDYGYLGLEYKPASWFRTYAEYGYSKQETKDSENKFAIGARVYW